MIAPCLDEEQALAFLAGDLAADRHGTVEAHVDDCNSCRQVLAALVRNVASAGTLPGHTRAQAAQRWEVGHAIGRYVIRGRIGRGGMGSVYRADDTELGRAVALKRLHAAADTEARARLVREARAAAQLSHPNVVTIYEVGDDAGTPFIAMELIDGMTLTAWLAESPRPWRAIVAVLAQAGRGLAAAHDHGLVHRDFKPDNVLVDHSGRARVADFGLARAGDTPPGTHEDAPAARDARLARLTATGSLAGTPAYLAPELVDGATPDPRSDQYAFAITLFEALRGQHPFPGASPEAMWTAMAAGKIRDGGRDVPGWLDRHVRRGLAVAPAERWPDVASFVAAIDGRDLSPASSATAWRRGWIVRGARRPIWPLLVGGGALAAAIAVVLALPSSHRDPCSDTAAPIAALWPARRAAVEGSLPRDVAPATLAALDAFAERWRTGAQAACRATTDGSQSHELADRRAACLDRARIRIEAVLDDIAKPGALASAESLPDLAACADLAQLQHGEPLPTSRKDREQLDAAERDLAHIDLLRDRGELHAAGSLIAGVRATAKRLDAYSLLARTELAANELARDLGDGDAQSTSAFAAWSAAGNAGDSDLTQIAMLALISAGEQTDAKMLDQIAAPTEGASRMDARVYRAFGVAQRNAGRYADSIASLERAQAILARLLPEDSLDRLLADFELAGTLVMHGEAAAALPTLQRVNAALTKRVAPLRREALDALHVLSMAEAATGNSTAAIADESEVLARRTELFGAHAAVTAVTREQLATRLDDAGRHAESVAARELAITDLLAAPHEPVVSVAEARVNLATDYIELGRYDDAIAVLSLARPVLVKAHGEQHPDVAIADLALVHARVARATATHTTAGLADDVALLDRLQQGFAQTFGASSQPVAAVLEVRGSLEAARGQWAAADRAYASSLAALGDHAGSDRADVELERARALWQLHQLAAARAAAQAAVADYQTAGRDERVAAARTWLAAHT